MYRLSLNPLVETHSNESLRVNLQPSGVEASSMPICLREGLCVGSRQRNHHYEGFFLKELGGLCAFVVCKKIRNEVG